MKKGIDLGMVDTLCYFAKEYTICAIELKFLVDL